MVLLDLVPFLRHFDRFLGFGIESTMHGNDAILEFIQRVNFQERNSVFDLAVYFLFEQFDHHKRMINYDQEPSNYLDAYIHELHRREKEGIQGYPRNTYTVFA